MREIFERDALRAGDFLAYAASGSVTLHPIRRTERCTSDNYRHRRRLDSEYAENL